MSKVKVIYYGLIKNKVDSQDDEIHISGEATVRELLRLLVERHGNEFRDKLLTSDWQLQPLVMIHLNGRDVNDIDGLNTKLTDNSELSIMLLAYVQTGG